jgi:hypothetical protein
MRFEEGGNHYKLQIRTAKIVLMKQLKKDEMHIKIKIVFKMFGIE